MKKKLLTLVFSICVLLSLASCDIKFNIGSKTSTIEITKKEFTTRMSEGLNVTIDNQVMDFSSGKSYLDAHYNGNELKTKMSDLLAQVENINTEFFALYKNYVKAVNAELKSEATDFYTYKSEALNSYVSEATIEGILDVVDDLDDDLELQLLLPTVQANNTRVLQNTNYSKCRNINLTTNNLTSYVNTFAEQYKSLPFMATANQEKIVTFLDTYDIDIENTNTIDYDGYTALSNGIPTALTLKNYDSTLNVISTMSHEIGHVSDTAFSSLETDEAYACATEALTYYLADTFNFNTDYPKINYYYKQRVLYDVLNSFYGWVGYLSFLKQTYNYTNILTLDTIKGFMDNTYSSVSYSYPEEYSILWKTMWIYYAYYDVSNSGSFVYTYGAMNSAYLWDLYQTNPTEAKSKYQALMSYDGSFENFDDIGLIGEANIADSFSSLKKVIKEDIALITLLSL